MRDDKQVSNTNDDTSTPSGKGPEKGSAGGLLRRLPRLNLGGILSVTLVVLVGVGTYYYFRTSGNWANLQQRNLRELARMARTIEARVDNFDAIISNLNREATLAIGRKFQDEASAAATALAIAKSTPLRARALVRGVIDADWNPPQQDGGRAPPLAAEEGNNGSPSQGEADPGEENVLQETEDESDAWGPWATKCKDLARQQGRVVLRPDFDVSSAVICVENLALNIDLRDLLGPIIESESLGRDVFGRVRFFEHVFVAESNGTAFLHSGTSGVRLRKVPATPVAGTGQQQGGAPTADVWRQVRVTDVRSEEIGGEDYLLFLQPIRIQLGAASRDDTEWILGALVSRRDFRYESLALDPTEMIVLVLGILFTLLGLPFLRMWKMGGWERLEARHVMFAAFCLAAGVGIVALCLVEVAFYSRVQDQVDERLREVTKQLEANLYAEIGDALEGLDEISRLWFDEFSKLAPLTRRRLGTLEEPDYGLLRSAADELQRNQRDRPAEARSGTEGLWTKLSPFVIDDLLVELPRRLGGGKRIRADKFFDYPHFEMVTWMSAGGQQVGKWTIRKEPTPLLDASEREYFRRIRDGRHWVRTDATEPDSPRSAYFLEVVRSRNTGDTLAELAIPIEQSGFNGVAAMATKFTAVTAPVLPPGVGFAIIELDGDTLLHFNPERNLEENFFEETDFNPRLRAAVAARAEHPDNLDPFNARYMGRDMRMFIVPLRDTPLSVVTYLDRSQLRTINLEIVSLTMVLFAIYNLALLVVLGLLSLRWKQRRLRWAWPDERRPYKFLAIAAVQSVFVAELVWLLVRGHSQDAALHLPAIFLIPLQAIGLGLAVLAWDGRRWFGLSLTTVSLALLVAANYYLGAPTSVALVAPIVCGVAVVMALLGNPRLGRGGWSYLPRSPLRRWLGPGLQRSAEWFRSVGYSSWHFVAAGSLAVIVIGLLPPPMFFQVVQQMHLELLVRHREKQLVESLYDRSERLSRFFGELGSIEQSSDTYEQMRRARVDFQWRLDLALGTFSRVCWGSEGQGMTLSCTPTNLIPEGDPSMPAPMSEVEFIPHDHGDGSATSRTLIGRLAHIPYYNEVSVATRFLQSENTGPDGWSWQHGRPSDSDGDLDYLLVSAAPAYLSAADTSPRSGPTYGVVAPIPRGNLLPNNWRSGIVWLLGIPFVLIGLVSLVRFQGRKAFMIDLAYAQPLPLTTVALQPVEDPRFLVCPDWSDRAPLRDKQARKRAGLAPIEFVDLGKGGAELVSKRAANDGAVSCFDYVDRDLRDQDRNLELLNALETLIADDERGILLISSRHLEPELFVPLAFVGGGEQDDGAEARKLAGRWTKVMAEFVPGIAVDSHDGEGFRDKRAYEAAIKSAYSHPPEAVAPDQRVAVLVRECFRSRPLQRIGLQVASRLGDRARTDDEMLDEIRLAASSHYTAIWDDLSRDEKLLVYQLSEGTMTTPAQRPTVIRLLQRGVVVRSPAVALMNRSFGRWVLATADRDRMRAWETEGAASVWQQMKLPLLVIVVTVAIFLFATQRQMFNASLAFVSAVTVGIPAIFRIVSTIGRGSGAGSA